MRRSAVLFSILMLAIAFGAVMADTPDTKTITTWSAKGFTPPPQFTKVFVLLASKNEKLRVTVEGAVSANLPLSIEGVPANFSIPNADLRNRPKVQKQLEGIHVDGVVVIRLVGKNKDVTWVPDSEPFFWGYYDWVYSADYWDNPQYMEPGFNIKKTTFQVEVKVYDLKTGKELWAAFTKSMDWDDSPKTGQNIIAAVEASLGQIGLAQ
jgi:hypothetical protein